MAKEIDSCHGILVVCLDWRLHPHIENFFKKKYKRLDIISVAGSIKHIVENNKFLFEQFGISIKLHAPKVAILTSHKDCGAYGGSRSFKNEKEEFGFHKNHLNLARKIVAQKFSNLKIEKYFIDLSHQKGKWKIKPIRIGP